MSIAKALPQNGSQAFSFGDEVAPKGMQPVSGETVSELEVLAKAGKAMVVCCSLLSLFRPSPSCLPLA